MLPPKLYLKYLVALILLFIFNFKNYSNTGMHQLIFNKIGILHDNRDFEAKKKLEIDTY